MYLNFRMCKRSTLRMLTFFFGVTALTLAGSSAAQNESRPELKYIEFTELGDPAEVLKVKREKSQPLEAGEVHLAEIDLS